MKEFLKNVLLEFRQIFDLVGLPDEQLYTANICNHTTDLAGYISDGMSMVYFKMRVTGNGQPDYCLECIGKMSIQCACCGLPIAIGEHIVRYVITRDEELPDYAVMRESEEGDYLYKTGCTRKACVSSGAIPSGRFLPLPPHKYEQLCST